VAPLPLSGWSNGRLGRHCVACRTLDLEPLYVSGSVRAASLGLVASENLRAVKVTAIGNRFELIRLQNSLRLLGNICKLCPIRAASCVAIRWCSVSTSTRTL
jgi:hypothetical protein